MDENAQRIPVKSLKNYPDLKFLKKFGRHEGFSPLNSSQWPYASELVKIFSGAADLDELISLALYVRDEINSQLFVYVYYVVMSHRFFNIVMPNPFEIMPQSFIKRSVMQQAKAAFHSQTANDEKQVCILKFLVRNFDCESKTQ